MQKSRVLVVGAGISGAVVARELAEAGFSVDVIDKRAHVAGNAYDYLNESGIRVHKYGPHIFHTNNQKVFLWLSKFTDWIDYQHKVKAILDDGSLVPIPPNAETLTTVPRESIVDTFYRPYTKKMWGIELEDLDPSVLQRVPVRDDNCDLYFPNDQYQAMPRLGYTQMVLNILNHERICTELGVQFSKAMEADYQQVFNSMPIDEYYEFIHGELPYRSIKFHHQELSIPRLFPVPTVNFTNDGRFTRVTEWKNYPGHGTNNKKTTITYEEPCDYRENDDERYYPVKDIDGENRARYKKYKEIANEKVTFIGRCGQYVYIDMHQAVASSLAVANRYIECQK